MATTLGALNAPRGLALDSAGDLWIVDSGNHRILHFPGTATTASAVVGQASPTVGSRNSGRGSGVQGDGFDVPAALVFDALDKLSYPSRLCESGWIIH